MMTDYEAMMSIIADGRAELSVLSLTMAVGNPVYYATVVDTRVPHHATPEGVMIRATVSYKDAIIRIDINDPDVLPWPDDDLLHWEFEKCMNRLIYSDEFAEVLEVMKSLCVMDSL